MAKLVDRLTALEVKRLTKVGMHPDGRGLYLQVDTGGAKSWIYRYTLNGRVRAMGLGPTHRISLAEARGLASRARDLKAEGIDPIDHRQEARPKPRVQAPQKPVFTFKAAAEGYIRANSAAWRNDKHRAQWSSTLKAYAEPVFGQLAVQEIDTELVLQGWSRFGASRPRPPAAFAGALKRSWIGRRFAATARATTPRGGRGTWTRSFLPSRRL